MIVKTKEKKKKFVISFFDLKIQTERQNHIFNYIDAMRRYFLSQNTEFKSNIGFFVQYFADVADPTIEGKNDKTEELVHGDGVPLL